MSAQQRIEAIRTEGYYIDFGDVFSKAFENYKKIALNAGLLFIVLTIIIVAVVFGIIGVGWGLGSVTESMADFNIGNFSIVVVLLYVAAMAVFSGLFAPINAGLIKMAYNAAHNQDFSLGTAFEYYKTAYFKELFVSGALIGFFGIGVSAAIESLHIPVLGAFLSYAISFFTFLTAPLIVFGDVKAIDAIKASSMIVSKQLFILLGLLIVAFIVACLGLIAFCIGMFFTLPIIYSMYYVIYEEIVGTGDRNELDEIGSSVD